MMDDELYHYGTKRHSGRYPWGSGENPYQDMQSTFKRNFDGKKGENNPFVDLQGSDFYRAASEAKKWVKENTGKKNPTDADVIRAMGLDMKSTEYRAKYTLGRNMVLADNIATAEKYKAKGMGATAIAERMNTNESTVRSWLEPGRKERATKMESTSKTLEDAVAKHKYVDISKGTESHMGISATALKSSVAYLKEQGYKEYRLDVEQLGTGHYTTMKVLGAPGTTWKDMYEHRGEIGIVTSKSDDLGRSFVDVEPPKSISSKRVAVRYREEGGLDMDGVVEIRPGVDDISLGNARYAQVRIKVDDSHYIKGMAMYSNDLPDGVDLRFNTNKPKGTPMMGPKDNTVLKPLKEDPENPFGATIKFDDELVLAQRHYVDKNGKKQQSCINIVNEEGDWGQWKKSLSSQVLSKQSVPLAKELLGKVYSEKRKEYEEIMSITNPTVKKKLLETFGDECDSAATHLKGAALPRQGSYVILPFPKMKKDEIYAPGFEDGEKVVLIRYPHGGKFEIPELTVNNKNRIAKQTLGNDAKDAVGIHSSVAERLSGADFDGDTVLVIPNNSKRIKTAPPLEGLKDFDPKIAYPAVDGMKKMTKKGTQAEMGKISNLITDMTIKGADADEIARAVRHSMVVIDAEKHSLNYTKSFEDNRIAELKEKYQGAANAGASTIISQASSETRINQRSARYTIDPETGKKTYFETGRTWTKTEQKKNRKTGEIEEIDKEIVSQDKVSKMSVVDDAYELTSGGSKANLKYQMEGVYAEHANRLKALANESRKSFLSVKENTYSPAARKVYQKEYLDLKEKLRLAKLNAPFERRAQIEAGIKYRARAKVNPDWDNADKQKARGQELTKARLRVGVAKNQITITDREWEAIQAGAISNTMLKEILSKTDMDKVKERCMPKSTTTMTASQTSRAKSMIARGLTLAQVANALGVSVSTVERYV